MAKHQFKKQFGQNFLRNDRFAQILLEEADIQTEDTVIEIGPGDGRVTNLLLQQAKKVIAIEIDYDAVVELVRRFGDNQDFELINESFLDIDFNTLVADYGLPDNYKLVSSLPFNVAKQILRKIMNFPIVPETMAVILQQEVAENYAAQPPKATFLSNWLRLRADVSKSVNINKKQFFPVPNVNGAILRIAPFQLSAAETKDIKALSKFIKIGFSSPRKTLANNLKASNKYETEKINTIFAELELAKQRPAELELSTWKELFAKLEHA